MSPLDPTKLRDRLILSGVLSPAFLLIFLWIYYLSPNNKVVSMAEALAFMVAMSFVSAHCVTLFITGLMGRWPRPQESKLVATETRKVNVQAHQ